jgi:hypothetical protein
VARRLAVLAALALPVALSSVPSSADESTCTPTYARTAGSTKTSPSRQGTGSVILLAADVDADYYRAGSIVYAITGPSGSVDVRGRSATDWTARYRSPTPGHFTVTARWQVISCGDIDGTLYYTDVVGQPADLDIVARAARARIEWRGTPAPGRRLTAHYGKPIAGLSGYMLCPDPDLAAPDPTRFTFRYETGGARPGPSSPKVSFKLTCPIGKARSHRYPRPWGGIGRNQFGGGISSRRPLRAWIEVSAGGEALASIRIRIRPSRRGIRMTPDSGPCATPCARTWAHT